MEQRCVIFTAYFEGNPREVYRPEAGDYILCADGGYRYALAAGAAPALVIGDCDSGVDIPEALLQRVPVEKDDTDTMLCIKHAVEQGFSRCLLLGGIGGRLDHTIANIQSLAYAHAHGLRTEWLDANERLFFLEQGACSIPHAEGYTLSLFAYSEACHGVEETGVQYPLSNATLTQSFPLGVSNTITAPTAHVSVREGLLLVVQSRQR